MTAALKQVGFTNVLFQILEINVLNYVKFFTSQAFKLSGYPFPLICIGVKLEDNF